MKPTKLSFKNLVEGKSSEFRYDFCLHASKGDFIANKDLPKQTRSSFDYKIDNSTDICIFK